MPKISPFCGIRYDPSKVDLESVVAPPYDVVTEEEVEFFLKRSPYNVFHLEIGEGNDRYERAALLFRRWLSEGILLKEKEPVVYLYKIRFSFEGRSFVRKGFVTLVRVSPFDKGEVLPHEKTFPKVTQDRFNLLKTTLAQFSQVFSLYSDPEGLTTSFEPKGDPLYRIDYEGVLHELYAVRDEGLLNMLKTLVGNNPIYIADGHHRYTTALKFAEEMERLYGRKDGCFHYQMMYLCAVEDPGLLVLPTHRVIKVPRSFDAVFEVLEGRWEFKEVEFGRAPSEGEILWWSKGRALSLRPSKELLKELGEREGLPVEELPAAWCSYLVERLFGVSEAVLKERGELFYTPWIEEVREYIKEGACAFVLSRTSVSTLQKVAREGKVMPHKSTYFYPKILTGLVMYEIEPEKEPPC